MFLTYHMVSSCRRLELHLENAGLETERNWQLVLGDIDTSALQHLNLDNTNVSKAMKVLQVLMFSRLGLM